MPQVQGKGPKIFNQYTKMKIIETDFADNGYHKIYLHCQKIFGDKNVFLEGDKKEGFHGLNVSGDIELKLGFSGNEFKVYFGVGRSFRILCFSDIIKYLDFKSTELELIKSIEG